MSKTLIGPQLRQLRRRHSETQADMARRLGISAAYVNLLENNQRSLSVQVLMALTEAYGIDMRSLVQDSASARLADLRAAVRDPIFHRDPPDIAELRGAIDHAPDIVDRFLHLYQSHRGLMEQMKRIAGADGAQSLLNVTPETAIHDYFRDQSNYFDGLERAAEAMRDRIGGQTDDLYTLLKRQLRLDFGIETAVLPVSAMPQSLRTFDQEAGVVHLSEALDHTNRIFQLAHVLGLLIVQDEVETLVSRSGIETEAGRARLKVELTNYFAAALLMPYRAFLTLAEETGYDLLYMAARFGVSFEQIGHRLSTLQRDGARGVPFFFLRVDRAGNVTKRFNATAFVLAEEGGACPVWDIHGAFRAPGSLVPQFVELPDGGQFFTLSRTSDRPELGRHMQDRHVVVTVGCDVQHAEKLVYARAFNRSAPELFSPIGINCHVCPRQACAQRAHQPLHMQLPLDTHRRGRTRYES